MHHHDHNHPDSHGSHPGGDPSRRLALALALTLAYAAAEVAGGLLSNSLALLADAGHMLTDALALGLALAAAWFSRRPPDTGRSYGYQRAEILAALANAVALVVICGFLFWEAIERFSSPPEIRSGLMAAVAAGGLVVNLACALVLHGGAGLHVRGAFLHVVGDLLGSVGALVAAGLIAAFGWTWADPVATIVIGAIIVVGSVRLLLESVHVLMEGVPKGFDLETVRGELLRVPGVGGVHDLHVWTLAGRAPVLTAHLVTDHTVPAPEILRNATRSLHGRFGIEHATLQIEPPDFNIVEPLTTSPGRKPASR